jgi:hypothetical protein
MATAGKTAARIPQMLLNGFLWLMAVLFIKAPRSLFKSISNAFKRPGHKKQFRSAHAAGTLPRSSYAVPSYHAVLNPFTLIKKLLYYILYVVLFPLRLVLRHAGLSAVIIAALYVFLAYTSPGKLIAYRYMGTDIVKVQTKAYSTASEILTYAWEEFMDISGIGRNDYSAILEEVQAEPEDTAVQAQRQFRVTANTGLNLRKAPGETSEKVTENMLASNTVLNFLSKEEKDSSGKIWLYVSTPDGKTGWVSARWLEELGGGKIEG